MPCFNSFTIFFGANDSCLPDSASGQFCPLAEYKQNLKDLLTHNTVAAHHPRLILITPPPIDEHQLEAVDLAKDDAEAQRSATNTRKYATACREAGEELGIAVLDLWSIIMAKTGWKEGHPLVGSKEVPRSEVLKRTLVDEVA
ncbi:MAG: hypothetical protein Q9163_006162 [Psora crenata]